MASRRRRLDPVGPFGNPDGSRADIEDLISEFVDFGGNPAYGHLATRANDSKVRVIVGKLGAGKTVYLRRLQDFQSHQDSVYADVPQQSLPKTEVIVKACQWFSDSVLVEKWMQIWERAIMRALASHLLLRPELRAQVDDRQAAEIERSYARLLGDFRRPRSIYSQVRDIINERQTAHQLSAYLDDPLWDDLEDLLGEVVIRCKPIYFYLDAVDEEFSHAPMYWLKCQEGLFYQVMRLLRDHKLGGRLHVVVCIRDIVMSSVYRSEHAPRYYNEPHIRVLTWDRGSLLYLLGQKLARLPPSLLMRRPASGAPTIGDWLGVDGQWPGPDGDGPIEDYLLSHTRLLPRDIISLGNELSEEVLRQKQAGLAGLPPAVLQAVVQRCAKRFGDSQLAQCANQISSDLMPEGAALHDYSELFTSTQSYISGVQEDVRSFVRMIGVDRFSRGDLLALQEVADLHFQEPTNLASVLWQNGLLGYVDEAGRRRFYSLGDVEQFHLPPEAGIYVLHPCLVYAVGGIRHVGEQDSAGAGDARRTRPLTSPKRSGLPEAPDAAPRSGGNRALLEPGPAEVRDRQVTGLPSGLITLLFSDIEGSTRLVKALRDRYWQILAEHRRLIRAAVAEYAGYEVDAQGDAFFVTFDDAKQAVLCALEIQRALAGHQWPADTPVRVRIGIHTGHAVPADGAYTGLAVHRAARICAAARGGQVFLSQATQTLIEDEEEDLGFALVDLGEHRLKDLDRPVRLFQLAAPGLGATVPADLPVRGEPSGAVAPDQTVPRGLTSGSAHRLQPRRRTLATRDQRQMRMFWVRSLPQPNGPASALDLPVSAHTRREGPGCRPKRRCPRPGSGRCADPRCQTAATASPALALRVAFDQAQPGRHHRLSAWRSIASSPGSAPISRTSCAQRQATAILAAHCSASSREGTSTSVNPPMASGYGPSVTAPSMATMLAGRFSSPPPDTYTPALMASWTAACAALATAGMSSPGMWSIAWAPNEIRYCTIHGSVVPAACSGRVLTHRRTTRPGSIAPPGEISHGSRHSASASVICPVFAEIIAVAADYEQSNRTHLMPQ